jgi:hypothetical protein
LLKSVGIYLACLIKIQLMKNTLILIAVLFYAKIFSQEWTWAYTGGMKAGNDIVLDKDGNLYGIALGSTPYPDYVPLASKRDGVVFKHNSSGKVIWAVDISRCGTLNAISIDDSANVYLTGSCENTLFYSTQGGPTLVNPNNTAQQDGFIAKYNSNGVLCWVKTFNFPDSNDDSITISTTGDGTSYVAGYMVNWDYYVATNKYFLRKYGKNGDLLWNNESGWNTPVIPKCVAVNSRGECFFTGVFTDTAATFNNLLLTSTNTIETTFLAKYDAVGQIQWIKRISDNSAQAINVKISNDNNIFITGSFISPFKCDNLVLNSATGRGMFVLKLDSNGTATWLSGSSGGRGTSICIGENGDIFSAGYFTSSVTFLNGKVLSSAPKDGDLFVARYNSSGEFEWALKPAGVSDHGYNTASAIATFKNNIYITGAFAGNTTFGNFSFNVNTGTYGDVTDQFIAKITDLTIITSDISSVLFKSRIMVYPVPSSKYFNIRLVDLKPGEYEVAISNTLGENIAFQTVSLKSQDQTFFMYLGSELKGIYFVTVLSSQQKLTCKVVLQ